MAIATQPIKSSNIAEAGYDQVTATLAVKFHHGGTYHYKEVPPSVAEAFLTSGAPGSYFHSTIKAGYKAEKQ